MNLDSEISFIESQQLTDSNGDWIQTEEQLLSQTWYMVNLITSCDKTMLAEEYVDYCMPCIQGDLVEGYHLNWLVETAKKHFNCTAKEVILRCLSYTWDLSEDGIYLIKDIEEAINTLEIIDCKLVYPERWFSKELYSKISELLKTFDFVRTKYKGRVAYEREGEFTAEQVLQVAKELKGISLSTQFNFFPTPSEVVSRVQELAYIQDEDYILEPSAGTGSLIAGLNKDKIYCVEMNEVLCGILRSKGYNTVSKSFEEAIFTCKFDKILMNPPFQKRTDAKHIAQAFENLKDGGILVAVHSSGIITSTDKYSKKYQELFSNYGTHREKIDSGAFKNSGKGTMIETYISVFKK